MSKSRCTHKTMDDHRRGVFWICSGCGGSFKWGGESYYFGNMECLKCGRADIWKVFCGVHCRREAGDPKTWRSDEDRGEVGTVAAGEGVPALSLADDHPAVPPEAMHAGHPPRAVAVVLTEQELMEIMVSLVEAAKDRCCSAERAARIRILLEEKVDRAMRQIRL